MDPVGQNQVLLHAEDRWNHIPKRYRLFDLTIDEELQFQRAISTIKEQRSRVEDLSSASVAKGSAKGTMLIFNQDFEDPPLCWCFNNWAEPYLYINGNELRSPLFAMQSYHGVLDTWRDKTRNHEHFANLYFQEIRSSTLAEPILIGNCQGGPIMESIALLYLEKLQIKPLLITIDYFPRRFYPGPMVLLYGKESNFNPFFNSKIDPILFLKSKLRDFGWGIIRANHGGYFREPGIGQLRLFVSKSIEIHTSKNNFGQREILIDHSWE